MQKKKSKHKNTKGDTNMLSEIKTVVLKFFSTSTKSKILAVAATVIVFAIGYMVFRAGATGFYAATEVDDGVISGNSKIVSDSDASNGKAVEFFAPVSSPAPAPAPEPDPDPDPTPPPSGGGSSAICPPFPAFPDGNCTGWKHTGVTLQNYTGPMTITTNGTVIEGKRIAGSLCIMASDVTVRKSKIEGIVYTNDGGRPSCSSLPRSTNTLLEDVEIIGPGTPTSSDSSIATAKAVQGSNFTCLRCEVHRWGSGFYVRQNVVIEDSYIHDTIGSSGSHRACIGGNGAINATYRHNNVYCNSLNGGPGISGAIVLYSDPAKFLPNKNVLVEKNLIFATASYCLYAIEKSTPPNQENVRIIDNRFHRSAQNPTCGQFGPIQYTSTGLTLSGNKYTDGTPVP
jgi:hypothetical protein